MNDGDARLTWSSDHSFKGRLAWEGGGGRGPLKLIAPTPIIRTYLLPLEDPHRPLIS